MKPFDIEKAKAGAPLCTRDGRPARIVCWDFQRNDYPLLVAVMNEEGEEFWTYSVTKAGRYHGARGLDNQNDLFLAPTKHEGWVNVYKEEGEGAYMGRFISKTKEEADKVSSLSRVACVHIEWEE